MIFFSLPVPCAEGDDADDCDQDRCRSYRIFTDRVGHGLDQFVDLAFRLDLALFAAALTETLEKDCSYDVVQAVHEQLRGRIQEHKESRDPEPLTLSVREVGDVLTGSGVPEEKVEAFQDQCRRQYGRTRP